MRQMWSQDTYHLWTLQLRWQGHTHIKTSTLQLTPQQHTHINDKHCNPISPGESWSEQGEVYEHATSLEHLGTECRERVGELQLFAWTPPWTPNEMSWCTHLHVNASFKGARPYAYYIPQPITANRWLAWLVVPPNEKDELFLSYHRLLRFHELGINHPPVLADLGGAIHSFAEQEGLKLYMCHRHRLEAIGSSSCASVVQRAEIEWGGITARHASGRFALNLGNRVNLRKFHWLPS